MVTYTPYGGAIEHSGDGGRVTGRVYRVGHKAPSVEARYMAAVKAGGDDALLCDGAAGYLLEILRCRTVPSPSVLTPTARRIKGVRVKRTRRVDPRDATKVRNIPVTAVPRTIVDLAAVLGDEALARGQGRPAGRLPLARQRRGR